MSEYFDVIIIGAGIAGCGLAYNLAKRQYKGRVLVIDKKGPGSNASFVYRNTFLEIIEEYNLPYERRFEGAVVGSYDSPTKIKEDFYFIDYKKACNHLLNASGCRLKQEKALSIKKRLLKTDKSEYHFGYLIDCSGSSFFLRKLYGLPLPFRYWIGEVKLIRPKIRFNLGNYFYFYISKKDPDYLEDIYAVKNKVIHGDWLYLNLPKEQKIIRPKKSFLKSIKKQKIIIKTHAVIPSTPAFPLFFKNFAFLGDSFGNASASVSEGIRPILNTSKILAKAIENQNLKNYESNWKKENLNSYLRKLSLKLSSKLKIKLIEIIKGDSQLLKKMMKNEEVKLPKRIMKKIPLRLKSEIIKNYILLKMKYKYQNLKIIFNPHIWFV